MPVVPGRLRGRVGAALPVRPAQEPLALVAFADRGKLVGYVGAAHYVEPVRAPAPLAFIRAGLKAQPCVVEVLEAAVLAFREQAGGSLVAAVA